MVAEEQGVVGFSDTEQEYNNATNKKKKTVSLTKKTGGFQSMGLAFPLLKAVQKRGYKVPTPIQRKTIPLVLEGRDVVAMARTGSGKTACFLLPILEKLHRQPVTSRLIRALVLCPTRELALQTVRFVKELGKFTNVKHCCVVGGDTIESQFSALHSHPDLVIATPGRLLHVCVEMQLKLDSVQFLVLDEADRLFEMGLDEELKEILSRLSEGRQTLLFSATLPRALVHFARLGLSDPVLIRLDVESKLPPTLDVSFLLCRPEEKSSTLLLLLKQVVPPYKSTIVFTATKHHVQYIYSLLSSAGLKSTFLYSDLDASARKINTAKFQTGQCRILVVTDLAARGIDIPSVDYVINYNFPAKPKLFVHRVGRCARAGRNGWAVSLVSKDEICYMLDLHLFLGRPLALVPPGTVSTDTKLVGSAPRLLVEDQLDQILQWEAVSFELVSTRNTSENAYKHYLKCRPGASRESVRRSKEVASTIVGVHALFKDSDCSDSNNTSALSKASLISSIQAYRPPGTIFEIGQSSRSELYQVMKRKREAHKDKIRLHKKPACQTDTNTADKDQESLSPSTSTATSLFKTQPCDSEEKVDAEEIGRTFSRIIGNKRDVASNRQDVEHYIPYRPSDHHTETGLAVCSLDRDGSAVNLDLTADTESGLKSNRSKILGDKRNKKMAATQEKSKKIRSESGAWISSSYRSGKYQQWMDKTKVLEQQNQYGMDNPSQEEEKSNVSQTDTHWRRHNLKAKEKSRNVGLKTPEQIARQRIEKDKRRRRNGPKPKRHRRK